MSKLFVQFYSKSSGSRYKFAYHKAFIQKTICGFFGILEICKLRKSAGPLGPPGCEAYPWDIVLPSWWFKPQDWWMVSIWMLFSCPLERDRYPHRCTFPQLRGPSGEPRKIINFRASLRANKNHENETQAHPKSWKIDPGIIRNPISAKVDFCNTFHAKCLFLYDLTLKFIPKNHQKKQPLNSYEQIFFFAPKVPKTLSKWIP